MSGAGAAGTDVAGAFDVWEQPAAAVPEGGSGLPAEGDAAWSGLLELLTAAERRRVEGLLGELRRLPRWTGVRPGEEGYGEPPGSGKGFPAQAAFIEDEASHLALVCTRRAGKSHGIVLRVLRDAWSHPGANYLYAGITLESARKAIWKDGFMAVSARMGLGLRFNETHNTVTTPGRAVVYVIGMDRPEQLRKVRGTGYRGAVVDEAQDFSPPVLHSLVAEVLQPALIDARGWLVLAGTPGAVPMGLFHSLTGRVDPSRGGLGGRVRRSDAATAAVWTVRGWSTHANPHMREQWAADDARMREVNPRIVETPGYRRERLGLWEQDREGRVYRCRPGMWPAGNDFDGTLPDMSEARGHGSWHHVLGVDLGWEDATAFVVGAYHDHHPVLHVVEAQAYGAKGGGKGLDFTDVAGRVRALDEKYGLETTVIDGANKQGVMEMRRRHGLALEAADKRDKFDFIDLLNDDFAKGAVLLAQPACAGLADEYEKLVLDPRVLARGRRAEHPACSQHLCDAMLYMWRHCRQWLAAAAPEAAMPGLTGEEERMWEGVARREAAERSADPWDGAERWE